MTKTELTRRPIDKSLPDLIVPWPINLDYPPFRLFIQLYRDWFNQVFVVFTPIESTWDFRKEVMEHMKKDYVYFIDTSLETYVNKDWRDVATNAGLRFCNSDWVLFMEQDFLISSAGHLAKLWDYRGFAKVIGFRQDERLHPAFLLVAKDLIDKTSKDFSPGKEPGQDHFWKFTKELEEMEKPLLLDEVDMVSGKDFLHMNGLSHNFHLCMVGKSPVYRPKEFNWYLKRSMRNIEVSPKYKDLVKLCKKALREGVQK